MPEEPKVYTGSFKWNGVDVNWTVNQKGFAKDFNWTSYKYCNGIKNSLTKYNTYDYYGTVDNKTVLENVDDAAIQNLRSQPGHENAHMPSETDCQNLKNGTLWVWSPANTIVKVKAKDSEGKDTIIDVNYPAGYFVYKVKDEADKGKVVYAGGEIPTNYSPNAHYEGEGESQVIVDGDTHIFFPCSGYADGTGVDDRGSRGYYWNTSLDTSQDDRGGSLYCGIYGMNPTIHTIRYRGFCIRSVSEK